MLVLTRKTNQSIRIGDEVIVTVLAVRGSSVRIGIEAPLTIDIVRTEIDHDHHDTQKEGKR